MSSFNKKEYDLQYSKDNYKQFKAKLKIEEMEQLNNLLNKKNINKTEFIRNSFIYLKKGCFEMKINNLYKINNLNEKAGMLLNHNIDNDFYDFYMNNEINWLIENEDKINKDFTNNINELKFDIILNSNLDERINLIVELKKASVEEFSNYISHIPFESLKKEEKKNIEKVFEKFNKIDDNYDLIKYFDSVCRK